TRDGGSALVATGIMAPAALTGSPSCAWFASSAQARVPPAVAAVVDRPGDPLERAGIAEVSAGRPRLHDGDGYAERGEFRAQGLAQALHGEFGGAVHAPARSGAEPAHGADVEYPTGSLAPHHRQHGARDGQQAEYVGVEHVADLLGRGLFDRTEQPAA